LPRSLGVNYFRADVLIPVEIPDEAFATISRAC